MSYADLAEFKRRLGSIFAGTYDDEDDALDDLAAAAAEIDGRLAARYRTPIAGAPGILKNWNLTLAEELTCSRSAAPDISPKLKYRVEEVRKQLAECAAGLLKLSDAAENERESFATVEIERPVMTRRKMRGL